MKKVLVIYILLALLIGNSSFGQNKINGYRYWFDNDFASKISTTITPVENFELNTAIATSGLNSGAHIFNIQFWADSSYSSISSQFFYKAEASFAGTKEIIAYQYWLDNDYANATSINTSAVQQLNLIDNIDLNSLNSGAHIFNIRFKDNNNEWSLVSSSFFFKKPDVFASTKEIISYEYWLDNDYANSTLVNITASQQLNLIDNIDMSTINSGAHIFNIRFKDNNNEWSIVSNQFFYKKAIEPNMTNRLIEYRYWFDSDFANAIYNQFTPTSSFVNLTDDIDMTRIEKGEHIIHFQFKDTVNKWSLVTTDTIIKTALPIASFAYTTIIYCDSTVVSFTDSSMDGDIYYWDFGDGDTSVLNEPNHTYLSSGNFNVNLTVTDTTSGIDSTVSVLIIINPTETYDTISPVVCDTYTSPSGNYTWTTTNTYADTILNAMSCDSIITINLTVKNSSSDTINEVACDSYTSPSGKYIWTTSNTYFDTIFNSVGCDSLLTINLTVNTIDSSVTQTGITLTANASGLNYQWIDCANGNMEIVGETSQSFTPINNGIYAVVLDDNICYDTSACINISTIGIEEFEATNLKVYPNPNNGEFNIIFNDLLQGTYPINILNALGENVKQLQSTYPVTNVNLNNVENGVYLIQITTESKILLVRILKQ